MMFHPSEIPPEITAIPELDLSQDLLADPFKDDWFRLGIYSAPGKLSREGAQETVERSSLILATDGFAKLFDRLKSIGNVIANLGKPGEMVHPGVPPGPHRYVPFHRFEFSYSDVVAEPLVFMRDVNEGRVLFINPDIWLALELDEKDPGKEWWDPARGSEALRHHTLEGGMLEVVEIRTRHLKRYLQMRQQSLMIAHYRSVLVHNPAFKLQRGFAGEEAISLGSKDKGVRAIFESWGPQSDHGGDPYVRRRLHYWFEVKAQPVDPNNPWAEAPSFDAHLFTLPTRSGPVAPARWKDFPGRDRSKFEGALGDFMERIFFRQDVLGRYERATGFSVGDDGSVRCGSIWSLARGITRIGNELLSMYLGDFAEGLPFDEWPHWKSYAIEPPSQEAQDAFEQETPIPELVNGLGAALDNLNSAGVDLCRALKLKEKALWKGSLESLAARELKAFYQAAAPDEEFIKRMTFLSTLVIEGLDRTSLRSILEKLLPGLSKGKDGNTLGSRRLLERLALASAIEDATNPSPGELLAFIYIAEGSSRGADADLTSELAGIAKGIWTELAPLYFLYQIRNSGGVAHSPSKSALVNAAQSFGFREQGWRRREFLEVLARATKSINHAALFVDRCVDQRS